MNTIDTLILVPFKELISLVMSWIPTLVSVFIVFVVGLLIARIVHDVLLRVLKEIKIDKLSDKITLSRFIHHGGIKMQFSELVSAVIYWILILIFLVITAMAVGVYSGSAIVTAFLGYVSHVITAVLMLVLGLVIAHVISTMIHFVVSHMGVSHPDVYMKVSRWAIILYAIKMVLEELGYGVLFVPPLLYIWFTGLILALALAYGLGGRDSAAHHLSSKAKK
ncbi:MAG: hypothetical protein NUV91_09440 [Candidatus Omnitrophica bacterium]|nr:hypothetical protein [Candidatus Omnitrophota bacterium]